MASIYKKTRDKGRKNANWYVNYTDHLGKRRTVKGFTDRRATEQMAAKVEHEVMLRKRGLIDPEQERQHEVQTSSLEKHLTAFETSLGDNTPKHIKLTMARIRCVIDGCGFRTVSDLKPEPVESFLRQLCKEKDLGPTTYNHYVQAIDSFCKWMLLTQRITSNPLVSLERLNAQVDIRRKRRALTADEVALLVQSARESGEEIQCYDGETRARIYILAYFTGLRRQELASLRPSSFDLDGEQPTVTVEAACSKHRREDILPLHPELVEMLQEWLEGTNTDEPLFPRLAKRRTWRMVKLDLERVGIPYKTPEGVADFHAAGRHTYVTELLRNGVSLVEARELARHSDVRMTMKYTHIGLDDQAQAVGKLKGFAFAESSPVEDSSDPLETAPEKCPRSGHAPVDSACQNMATSGNGKASPRNDETPAGDRGYRRNSSSDRDCQKWRRRGSNPCYQRYRLSEHQQVTAVSDRHELARIGRIIEAWPNLPAQIRNAVEALCEKVASSHD